MTPDAATVGGFSHAGASAPKGTPATAATLTRLVGATAGGSAAAADIASHASSNVGGAVLSDAAGVATVDPSAAQVCHILKEGVLGAGPSGLACMWLPAACTAVCACWPPWPGTSHQAFETCIPTLLLPLLTLLGNWPH